MHCRQLQQHIIGWMDGRTDRWTDGWMEYAYVTCVIIVLLSLGILAGDWSVHLPSGPVCAVTGSSVVFPCSYNYPQSSNGLKEEGGLSAQVIQ